MNEAVTGYDKDENYETIVSAHKEDDVIVIDGVFQLAVESMKGKE